jgi:putative cell wall-binding protein
MLKKVFTLLAALVLFLQSAPQGLSWVVSEARAAEVPAGYMGVYSPEDLNKVRDNLAGSYILMNDLDLSGAIWQPIGNKSTPFKGVFDGNGHKITGMNITITSGQDVYAGLFGYINKAQIKNLGMVDSSVQVENNSLDSSTAKAYAGSIAGYADNYATISNSYNTGHVEATSLFASYAGGLAGFARYSTIQNSYNTGDVNAEDAGGIVGGVEYDPSKITDSYNTGNVTGTSSAGGITAFFSGSEIINSYNTGDITGYSTTGGIAAYGISAVIKNTENTGNIKGYYETGGIIGEFNETSVDRSHNSGTVTATSTYSGIAGGIAGALTTGVITSSYNVGLIQSESHAGGISGTISKSTIMKSYNSGAIEAKSRGGGILASIYSSSKVSNTFNIGDITGGYARGGIASSNAGTIENSYNAGLVKGTGSRAGGIVGENTGMILNSYYWDQQSKGAGSGDETGTLKKTAEEMSSPLTFEGFDFITVWTMEANEDYKLPKLLAAPFSGVEKNIGIALISPPLKLTYLDGEELDVTGAVITVTSNFLNKEDVKVTPDMISGFNKYSIGSQTVTITYQGFTTSFSVSVKDRTPPLKPTVNEFKERDYYLYGYAEAGADIEVWKGSSVIGRGTAGGTNGYFAVYVDKHPAWTELIVTAKDAAGNVSEGTKVVVKDITAPAKPTVNEVTDQSEAVTGTAEKDSTIDVIVNDSDNYTGLAGADGQFTVEIPVQKAGTKIVIMATDKAGHVSDGTIVTVKDVTAPVRPTVNEVTDQSTYVTGTAEKGSTVFVNFDQTKLGSATAKDDGSFIVSIPVQQAGKTLYVYSIDKAGNSSDSTGVLVKDVTAPAKPVVHELTDREWILTGTIEPLSTLIVKVSGKEIERKFFGYDEEFLIYLPSSFPAGTSVEVYAEDLAGNVSEASNIVVTAKLQELIGSTRYDTAVKVSQKGWDTANTVLLVNGFAIVDGLTATPLATAKDAPILLTAADSIPQPTMDEITRLKAKEIILIGGEGVITPKVAKELVDKGYNVTRIGGLNRKDTSLLIAKELDKLVDIITIYVAYGWGEPDALSIAAQAGLKKQPIILADKTAVPAETFAWLRTESLSDAYFIGGDGVVAPAIVSEIDRITSGNVSANRLSGLNRHETNAKVISKFYPDAELRSILLAKSETASLVDALAAGPLAAKLGSPVLLVSSYVGLLPAQRQVLDSKHSKYVHQIGGGVNPEAVGEVMQR